MRARAEVSVDAIATRAAVPARGGSTFVNVDAAVFSGEPGSASAFVIVVEDEAFAAVGAGLGEAEIDARFAARAQESGRALTALAVDQVHTGASMFADNARAVVDVYLAAVPAEPGAALAAEPVAGARARGPVPARVRGARVGLQRAVRAAVADGADAHVAGPARLAHAAVPAGPVGAGEAAGLAARALVPGGAGARQVAALVGHARAAVEAGPHGARVLRLVAVGAGVLVGADARVGALAGVVAGAPVAAGPVVGAVVEVLVAEQPAPALLADAVPGPAAGAVHAARVPLALVAQLAHPPRVAAGRDKRERQRRDNERLMAANKAPDE